MTPLPLSISQHLPPRCSRQRPRFRMVSAAEASGPTSGLRRGELAVRFTNTPHGDDVVVGAKPGDILLAVGDSAGIRIPRACVSGICGSCTCDIVDPNSPDGVQTIRACQTPVQDMDGSAEMVIDLSRMRETRMRKQSDPMARFNNIDTEYKAGAQPIRTNTGLRREMDCVACGAAGDIECYSCDGTGIEETSLDESAMCLLCSGSGQLRCADCQGTGIVKVR